MIKAFNIIFLAIVLSFFGCSEQTITINKNGTATVKMHLFKSPEAEKDSIFEASGQKNDSLDLEQLIKDFYAQTTVENLIGGWTNGLEYRLNLKFEKSISRIETDNKYVKQLDNHQIFIETSIGEMNFYGIENKLKVFFE